MVSMPRAADLPLKSHVRALPYIGDLWKHPKSPPEFPWFCSNGDELSSAAVQLMLDDGSAQVVRVGDGSGQ